MPSESLIDFERTDLSRVVFDAAEVQRFCKQRGRLALIDGVLHFAEHGELVIGFKDLSHQDWWTADHIPGRPIFPGILQCEGAAQLSTFDFLRRRPQMAGKFLGFAGMDSVRFRGVVQPPARMIWAARAKKFRGGMFIYQAQGFVERQMVFEGEILGMVL